MIKPNYLIHKGLLSVNTNKYTVDRFEGDLVVLLLKSDESQQKLIRKSQLNEEVNKGDIVEIEFDESGTLLDFKILTEETKDMKSRVESLLTKLKNKK